jgi:hypothetical protein
MLCYTECHRNHFEIDPHLVSIQLQEQSARLHGCSLVSVVKYVAGYDSPTNCGGLVDYRGIEFLIKYRTLNLIKHMIERPRVRKVVVTFKENAAERGDHPAVDFYDVCDR